MLKFRNKTKERSFKTISKLFLSVYFQHHELVSPQASAPGSLEVPGTQACSVLLQFSCPAPVLSLPHTLALVCPTSSCCLIHCPVHHHLTRSSSLKGTSSAELSVPETQSRPCLCSLKLPLYSRRESLLTS